MPDQFFADVFLRGSEEPTYCYRSGETVYEERLVRGTLVPCGWNAAGYPLNVLSNYPTYIDNTFIDAPSAFHVELDGECADFALEPIGFEQTRREDGSLECALKLKSGVKPVEITLRTLLDGTAVLSRRVEIKNLSENEMALSALSVMCGALEQRKNFRQLDPDAFPEDVYELGYFERSGWGGEGDLVWRPLPADKTSFSGRFGRGRYRHPAFFLKNKLSGRLFFGQLGWTSGYEFSFDSMSEHGGADITLCFGVSLAGHAPLYLIAPGETFISPEMHIGVLFGGLDEAVNAMNAHVRRSVLTLPEADPSACLVGGGMGPEHDMSVETTKRFMDLLAEMGSEVFIIDAGWYCPPDRETEWWSRAGDWQFDRDRYPDGIAEMRDYAHSKGLKFGMWMESERAGSASAVRARHPEWFCVFADGSPEPSGLIDLTNADALAWVESEAARIISEYQLDLFRIDYNISSISNYYVRTGASGRREYSAVRHNQALHGMYERLKRRFPTVIFENCAGGGGRTDLAMLKSFNHSWVSDWQSAPRSLYITSGMTLVLPPERVDRLFAGMGSHEFASLDFQMRNAMFTHMSLNVLSPAAAGFNPEQLAFVRHSVALYKSFIRPFLPKALIYHFNAEVPSARRAGFCALELVSPERGRAALGVFTLPGFGGGDITIAPRGLDLSADYRVTLDNTGDSFTLSGASLAQNGLTVRGLSPMRSELALFERL